MRRGLLRIATTAMLAAGLLLGGATPADASSRPVRLEAGPHIGYRFSTTGAVLGSRSITASGPQSSTTDQRRVVPNRSGIYLRLTSGSLRGYEVLESPVTYIPGLAGDTPYVPAAIVHFDAGKYLGYRFDGAWDLASTRYASLTNGSSAKADRRAVIDGRPYVHLSSGIWAGAWMPVTAPRSLTADRLRCSVQGKPAAGATIVLRTIPTGEAKVALTFDLGGRLTPALDIMKRLIVDRVCATIFPTGDAAETATGRTVLGLIAAHPELFETGNHTMHHCNLRDGGPGVACPTGAATASRIQSELRLAEGVIAAATGRSTKPYWRPPYGAYTTSIRNAAAVAGYTKTIMWHVDTIDWRPIQDGGPTAAAMAAKVVAGVDDGSIVLMHLGGYHTYDALPSMVLRLRADGRQPSTITDILD